MGKAMASEKLLALAEQLQIQPVKPLELKKETAAWVKGPATKWQKVWVRVSPELAAAPYG